MKEKVAEIISEHFLIDKKIAEKLIEIPPSSSLGDYSFPCFQFAVKLQKSPSEIAKEFSNKIQNKNFEKIEANGPYINFFLNRKFLAREILPEILRKKNKYGSEKIKKEKIMIEFSQPNTHKAFHIGHIRGTAIGESLARILDFLGAKVIRANYQGDSGMHVAKWIWCYKKFHANEKIKKDERWIAGIYTEAVSKLNENPNFQSEVDEINRKLDSKEDKEINEIWKKSRKVSLEVFEDIYKKLNTHFDVYFFESELEERAKEITQELLDKKIAEISDGAKIVRLENFGLGVWVLLRKDGTVLYSAKDLALAEKKFNQYKIDSSIYVLGAAQKLHFFQLLKTLELMNFKKAQNCKFVPVTEVRLPEGKMSSRTGQNILFSTFLEEIKTAAKEEIKKREKVSDRDLEKRALVISITALKYSMLKQDLHKSIVFDKNEAISFEGNTGPYLLYTYVRAKSILKKSNKKITKFSIPELTTKEKELIIKLASFPEKVKEAYSSLSPHIIANYVFELSQLFNEFYHSHQVLGSEQEQFRLALVASCAQVIKNSLYLLGIETIERM